jgi:bacterioferritin-associated ferredoxin
MIVCSCNAISEEKIKDSLNSETCPRTPGAVYRCLGCSPNCGRCYAAVQSIIKEALGNAEELTHKRSAALDRFKEEWATMQPAEHGHGSEACPARCEGCAAARADALEQDALEP